MPDMPEIPELPLEAFEVPPEAQEEVKDESGGSIKYGVLGLGQAGGRLAAEFYKIGYKKTVAINTAAHDLQTLELPDKQKFHIPAEGQSGAGKDMGKAAKAFAAKNQEIFDRLKFIFDKVDHVIICCGAGGGTGGGSVTQAIKLARDYMAYHGVEGKSRVGVIATIPDLGELRSERVAKNALQVLQDLAKDPPSPCVIVDNGKIGQMYKGIPPAKFWPTVNQTVVGLFDIMNKLSNMASNYTSFDPADYSSIIRSPGCCVMGVTRIKDLSDKMAVSAAVKHNLFKTLLAEGFDFTTASHAAAIAVGGKEIMANTAGLMESINYGFDTMATMTSGATVHRGIYEDGKDSLRIYTIIGGLGFPAEKMEQISKLAQGKVVDPLYGSGGQ